jgi:hypothetical protein
VKRVGAATVVLSLCATPVLARADGASGTDAAGRADALYKEGKALRRDRYYAAARMLFEESRRLDDGIGVTLYVADCFQHEGNLPSALSEFRRAEALAKDRGDDRATVAHQRAEGVARQLKAAPETAAPETAAPESTAPPNYGAESPVPAAHDGAHDTSSASKTQQWIGASVGGAGLVAAGAGAFLGVTAISRLAQSNAGPCIDDRCSPSGLALRQQAETASRWSTIAFVTAGASLAGGAVIYFTAPKGDAELAVAPMATAGGAGAVLAGTF